MSTFAYIRPIPVLLSFLVFQQIAKADTSISDIKGPAPITEEKPIGEPVPVPIPASKPKSVKGYWQQKFKTSPFVLHAKVTDVTYGITKNADGSKNPVTYVSYEILGSLKGKYSESKAVLSFSYFGPVGDGSDNIMMAEGVPIFVAGDELILFLKSNGNELNSVDDESILFVYQDNIYTSDSHPLLIDKGQDVALGKSEEIDSILDRDLKFNGAKVRIEADPLPDQDETGFQKIDRETFIRLFSKVSQSEDAFVSSKVGAFATSSYAGSPAVAPPKATK